MRCPITLWVALASIVLAAAGPAMAQSGYDRRGSDYQSFQIRNGDPAACAARCEHDGRCRAWSFSYPRTISTAAACRLKNKVPPRVEDQCCVSGVRGAGEIEPRQGTLEFGIDRFGGDYRNFETTPNPDAAACKAACDAENRCRAWTFVRPGYAGASARCYLKDKLKPPRHKPCCISGVVR
jgi:hypothetical protein